MHSVLRLTALWAILLSVLLCSALFAKTHTRERSLPPLSGKTMQTLVIGAFNLDDAADTIITVSNKTREQITVRPTLYSLAGERGLVNAITVDANDSLNLSLAKIVSSLDSRFRSGSVSLEYEGPRNAISADLSSRDGRGYLSRISHARYGKKSRSSVLNGVWWSAGNGSEMRIDLLNTSDDMVDVTLVLTEKSGTQNGSNTKLKLSPHEARVLRLGELNVHLTGTVGGVSIQHNGKPGALIADGYLWNPDSASRLEFPLRDPASSARSRYYVPGIAWTPFQTAPAKLLLRNTSSAPVVVTSTLQRGEKSRTLPDISLASNAVSVVEIPIVAAPNGTEPLSFSMSHSGDLGAVLAYWVNSEESGGMSTAPVIESSRAENGTVAWNIESDRHPVLYLQNTDASAETKYHVFARFRGGDYSWGLITLRPGETRAFDLRNARDGKIADARGRVIPGEVSTGQLEYQKRGTGPDAVGQLTTTSAAYVTPTYSVPSDCSCGATNRDVLLRSAVWNGFIGQSWDFAISQSDLGCSGWSPYYDIPPIEADWSSSNTSVVEVAQGRATIRGAGTAIVRANLMTTTYEYYCQPVQMIPEDCVPLKWPRTGWMCDSCTCVEEPLQVADEGEVKGKPTITGPNTVWWFNGQNPDPSTWPTQITLSSNANGTWAVTSGSDYVRLSSTSGSSITVTGTGAFSREVNDVSITLSVNGMTSNAFTITSKGPRVLANPYNLPRRCDGAGEVGWHYDRTYRVLDNFNNIMKNVPVSEGVGLPISDRADGLRFPAVMPKGGLTNASTGNFTDVIFVCASGSVTPMPENYTDGSGTSLVDHISQTWCAGSLASSLACTGAPVKSDTIYRYLGHGEVRIP